MAAKDLFSKRQPSNTKGSRPEAPVRTPAPRVLLVCEGEKTEQGFAQYGKGMKGVFALLEPKLPIAMQHATTLAAQPAEDAEYPNPSTQLHDLINQLQKIADRR